jgi:hypothetical protein
MATWKEERDLLIAQSKTFVQSVAGKTGDADHSFETRLPPASAVRPSTAERPANGLPARLTPLGHHDLRDEIRRRVAAFRDRQQAFNRERNEYCNAMMAKARAASE